MNNETRATFGAAALAAFNEACPTDEEDVVADMLTALMHHCHANGINFAEELARAKRNFATEAHQAKTPSKDAEH